MAVRRPPELPQPDSRFSGYVPAGRFLLPMSVMLADAKAEALAEEAALRAAELAALAQEEEPEVEEECVAIETPEPERPPRSVQIFSNDELGKMRPKVNPDKDKHLLAMLESAWRDQGMRPLPSWEDLPERVAKLRTSFGNFTELLGALECELILASVQAPEDFRIAPMLIVGEPGIGKTLFASELAKALGLPFTKITAGGAQGPFDFVGTSRHWSTSHPGRIFEFMALSDSASGVLLIDEVDKMHRDDRHPIVPALLDLLEGDSASTFRDEAFGVEFDASRLIILLTANDLGSIPPPLMSRLQVYEVESPDVAQREVIITQLWRQLQASTAHEIEIDADECQLLANQDSLDLRELKRLIQRAFASALVRRDKKIRFEMAARTQRTRMGFL